MADRTAAKIFGRVFDLLARDPSDDHRALAREVAGWMRGYDFHPVQTGATEAMVALGAARWTGADEDAELEVAEDAAAAEPQKGT